MTVNATPKITTHARERCAEMGISTKVAKRIWQNPSLRLPDFQGNPDRVFVYSTVEPLYCIVVVEHPDDQPEVVTVMYRSNEKVTRPKKEHA